MEPESPAPPADAPGAGAPAPAGEALARLVESCLDLVDAVALNLRASGLRTELDELRAFGRQGLVEAAIRFDAEKGEDFRRFAYYRVHGAMFDGVRKMGNWSRRGYERVRLLRAAQQVGESALDEGTDIGKLSGTAAHERLGSHLAQMAAAMALGVFAEPAFEGTEVVARDSARTVEEQLGDLQTAQVIRSALDELPQKESEVVRRVYLEGQHLDDVAADWGCSRSWVSRVHTRAIKRLSIRLRSLK